MGSRVSGSRDPRPPLAEGGVRAHTGSGEGGLKMVGVPHCMVGGYVETGAELNGVNEPVRSLHDAVKPKLHYAYDRCADAYLRMPT
ncbi:hypothetical protein B9Q06_04220 [Candidatus Marsarchaeota G2 archaeon ECH_B_2]|uniref:Uncharacterized protein n=3 Tax=Candidatus Marsarchaeota group 2 TaxID=2203771 RepID=A0A2R6BAV3_9ARCH|nr:MAG: hypothetical protein B9Q06_04220 [Candidatus Marsarchaeota G2 archaeon ECH_B_2]PSO00560.1 MAG: hypothetical protein B9Q07_03050 [Candidatus Marsarchaeota G2 archaeon ECH_B_3]PSO03155.1 MAG: hypothetical protein B9Q05_02090 [Candidatus Marsarchaeota G2 archaeon ECH_B_1]